MATQNYFKVKNGLEFPSIETLQTTDNTGPSIKPSLNLDFAKTKSLDPRITFTRASTATYYDGETSAKSEENLFTSSQDINGVGWNTLNIQTRTSNSTTAPDGTSTAGKFTSTTTDARHLLVNYIYGVAAGTTYTFSAYFKAAEYANIALGFENLTGGVKKSAILDLTTGMIKSLYDDNSSATFSNFSYTAVSVGNGWYRASVTATASISMSYITAQFTASPSYNPALSSGMPSYAGDGVSGLYIWGAQAEARDRTSAYTPTTTSPITNYIPVLQTAATNTARFDHDPITGESKGLLIEESRTNLILHSQSMDVSYWSIVNGSLIANATVAPDGSASADLYVANTTSSLKGVLPFGGVTISANSAHTLSYYVKSYGPQYVSLTFDDTATTNGLSATFDLVNGTVSRTATAYGTGTASGSSITPIGNGWYRISVSGTAGTGVSFARCILTIAPNSTAQFSSYTGNGFSGIYVWGAQLEAGTFATTYIPTSTTYSGRSSIATYKSNGLIQTAAVNVARYEQNASGGSNLLLENASTHATAYDVTLPGAWGPQASASVVPNTLDTIAPDGSYTALALIRGTTANYQIIQRTETFTAGTYTFSFYAKDNPLNPGAFFFQFNDGSWKSVYAVLASETLSVNGGTGTLSAVGNGWYRITWTIAVNAGSWMLTFHPYSNYIDAGNGVSTKQYLWGFQAESGSTATSYIPYNITHTGRSSTATYYDSTGTIRTAASGQPRYTYNPNLLTVAPKLLLEAAATNLVKYSEQLDNAVWGKVNCSITANAAVAPDGNQTADKLVANTTSGGHYVYQSVGGTAGVWSVYVKAAEYSRVTLGFYVDNQYPDTTAVFELSTGKWTKLAPYFATNPFGAQYVGNGWWRISIYSGAGDVINIGIADPSNVGTWDTTFAGDNTSGIYVWGAQVETGSGATSYIATTSATVTRAADTFTTAVRTRSADVYSSSQVTRAGDNPTITGTNFSSWYRPDEGTLYADFMLDSVLQTGIYAQIFDIRNSNDSAQRLSIFWNPGESANSGGFIQNVVEQATTYQSVAKGIPAKIAFAYKTNDAASSLNGGAIYSDNSVMLPVGINSANIGKSNGAALGKQYIKRIAYYPKRLTNAELVSITAQ